MDECPQDIGETSDEKKEDEPYILILELEPMKPKVVEMNVVVPAQPEQVDSAKDEDSEEEKPEDHDHIIPRYVRLNQNPDQIIGDKDAGVLTRRRIRDNSCMISTIESRTTKEAFGDDQWIKAMEVELEQIEKNNTWTLVPRPMNINVIGSKWVFRNKLDKDGLVVRNKARLVCKCYAQEEGEGCIYLISKITLP